MKTYYTSEIAAELGFSSTTLFEIVFNIELVKRGIQCETKDGLALTGDYDFMDYVEFERIPLEDGSIIYIRKWNQEGRDFLLDLLE